MTIKKTLFITAAALILAGCKIEITVPEGGRVVNQDATWACEAGETCSVDVVDIHFDQTYTAEPAEGMKFAGWERIHRSFCGGKMEPCHLYTSAFEANENLMAFLDKPEEVFHLNPTFVEDDGSGGEGEPICETTDEKLGNRTWDQLCRTGLDAAACGEHSGDFSMGSCETGGDQPTGYCEEDNGVRTYYYDHGVGHDLYEFGCQFVGTWHPLT